MIISNVYSMSNIPLSLLRYVHTKLKREFLIAKRRQRQNECYEYKMFGSVWTGNNN